MLFLLALPVAAQSLPDAPSHDRFFDRKNVTLFAIDAGAKAADGFYTHRNMERGSESDPVARPFVKTTAGQVAFFGASLGVDMLASYVAHRTGHHRLERIFPLIGMGLNISGAAYSTSHYHGHSGVPESFGGRR